MKQVALKTPARLVARLALDDIHVEAVFSELVRCDFPLAHWLPVPVEIPPNGTRSWYGTLGRSPAAERSVRAAAGVIHVPCYGESRLLDASPTPRSGHRVTAIEVERLAAATPVFALATKSHRIEQDHTRYLCASVLLAWPSRIAVVVSLDGTEGVASEGAPSHEWHVSASPGMPVERALSELLRRSKVFPVDGGSPHSLFVMPAVVGRSLLGRDGIPLACAPADGAPWGAEWRFDGFEALEAALERFRPGLQEFSAQVHPTA
jgi:hypothetical protein